MRFFIYTILLFISILSGKNVYAQLPIGELVQIEQIPEVPRALQNVIINLRSYSTDMQKASMIWFENGKEVSKGTGLTSFSTKTPAAGSKSTIRVVIQTAEGIVVEKTLTLQPADVDLVWETDGYLPPFYKGRSIFTHQSNITIVALPNFIDQSGKRVDPKTLVYTWKKDSTVLGSQSGYGKNSLSIKGGVVTRPTSISVDVTGVSNTLRGQASLDLEATDPEIVFYPESLLYGTMYNKAVTDRYGLQNNEVTLTAVPYFFAQSSKNSGALNYLWSINNIERPDLSKIDSITLRQTGDMDGESLISLRIDNPQNIFQTAQTNFSILFSSNNN